MTRDKRFDLTVFAALALVMLITRSHSLSQYVHLPDTSWASFFVAGYYIRSNHAFPALFLLAFAIDLVMIRLFAAPDFCFTIAYWLLVPAYGAMWLAGSWARKRLAFAPKSLPALVALLCGATLVAQLIASGGFYFFGGRFAHVTLAGFLPRLAHYFPMILAATLGWTSVAVLAHAVVILLRPDLAKARDR
jgi:hypothetical protein